MTREELLIELESSVKSCHRCGLRDSAAHVVFGEGFSEARLVFIGEGPGAEEDRLGRPFVGAAGQLLDRMLAAMGMDREHHAYILNVVKCRPPGNRTPEPSETASCRPHLEGQLSILDPAIVVLLGATAVKSLINPGMRITRVRGQWIQKDGRWWMPTYHPAALLRNPAWKRDAWSDLKQVIDKYRTLVDPSHDSPHYPRPS
ncbi:MAG: uracil-DNA glycosylase [Firmicutes bacterium]|nr:uracil-DNA glycosylase [Bacillota bacterium]